MSTTTLDLRGHDLIIILPEELASLPTPEPPQALRVYERVQVRQRYQLAGEPHYEGISKLERVG